MRLRTLLILGTVLCSPVAAQGKIDGNPLSLFCNEVGIACASFVSGALSGLNTNEAFRERVCLGDNVTLEKLIDVALAYERANELSELPAILVLMAAYVDAYPCAD